MVGIRAGDDGRCYGPEPGDGLESRRQSFGELCQFLVVFGESPGQVFDGQGQAFGFDAGDSDYRVGAV